MNLIVFLRLIRYKNLLLICYVFFLIYFFLFPSFKVNITLTHLHFFVLLFATLLITSAGYIINNIFDIESDKLNKPKKLIVSNLITVEKAKKYYLFINTLGIILGIGLCLQIEKPNLVFIFILVPLLLYYYSKKLQKIALVGNILVSLLIAFSIYMLALFEKSSINNSVYLIILTLSIFSFILNITREIIKDIIDIKGDFNCGLQTLPIILGIKRSSYVAMFFIFISIVLLTFLITSITGKHIVTRLYLVLTCLLPLLFVAIKLIKKPSHKTFNTLSSILKLIMFLGITSIILISYNL
ncbi:UbiA family prenyltransferase [Lutibacter sp. TH_r2]|uniref:UbiA family prenyltransferase n=1 Tax=Lutibacter sp. TH_r2 TaxID=3082083 RepID=UPI002954FA19|nr:UbiA family prenyltransferase [Lutibacter sp. TH_r2]MDV7188257.1 UbiA family prenyltransferase [Lutibacter sp. TH_r2]